MNRADVIVLRFRDALKRTERLSSDALLAYQQSLLTPLLLHAQMHAPFYAERLRAVVVDSAVDFTRWREIPVLSRAEAQRRELAMQASALPPHLGPVSADETSGSTGRPFRFLKNELMDISGLAMTDRMCRWWALDGDKDLAYFVSPRRHISRPEGVETRGWRSGNPAGRYLMRETTGSIEEHLDWLESMRPSYLVCYASMVIPLAQAARDRRALRLERVIARGGVVTKEAKSLCKAAFGASLIDQYGADEIGQISCECPHCGAHHVSAESVFVEILDADGEPVKPGETGRVVLTNLYNYAMPLIRYEIGDLATLAPARDDCEITLPSLTRIVGRYRNVFTLRDGRVLFPNVPMSGFRKFLPLVQIQVVQTDFDRLEVRYVADGSGDLPDSRGLAAWLRQGIDPCFRITVKEVPEIPASSDGKYEDFLSLVPGRQ